MLSVVLLASPGVVLLLIRHHSLRSERVTFTHRQTGDIVTFEAGLHAQQIGIDTVFQISRIEQVEMAGANHRFPELLVPA